MRLTVMAIGRLKRGPETELAERYFERATALGRNLGVTVDIKELPEGRGDRAADRAAREAEALGALIPEKAAIVVFDERGESIGSAEFSRMIDRWRGTGRDAALLIGGPDGFDEALRKKADRVLCFGVMTWPHQLARVLLAEQVYRAFSILAGHPYHRG